MCRVLLPQGVEPVLHHLPSDGEGSLRLGIENSGGVFEPLGYLATWSYMSVGRACRVDELDVVRVRPRPELLLYRFRRTDLLHLRVGRRLSATSGNRFHMLATIIDGRLGGRRRRCVADVTGCVAVRWPVGVHDGRNNRVGREARNVLKVLGGQGWAQRGSTWCTAEETRGARVGRRLAQSQQTEGPDSTVLISRRSHGP